MMHSEQALAVTKRDQGAFGEPIWIWSGDDPCDQNVWAWARRKFDLKRPVRATLEICADLRYTVCLNEKPFCFSVIIFCS